MRPLALHVQRFTRRIAASIKPTTPTPCLIEAMPPVRKTWEPAFGPILTYLPILRAISAMRFFCVVRLNLPPVVKSIPKLVTRLAVFMPTALSVGSNLALADLDDPTPTDLDLGSVFHGLRHLETSMLSAPSGFSSAARVMSPISATAAPSGPVTLMTMSSA